ncbi:SAGA-associated factor [Mortierella antarctica]|nr:SAGA-associated factor [Mortierella antarctica]
MEALFAKIHKDQASQLEMLRHTKRAMDKSIASKDGADSKANSLASLSFEILGELLDELILDVAVEAHRDVKNIRSNCPICKTKCRSYVVRPGVDIFGQNPQPNNSQMYDCVHCLRSFPAQRYAPHLEKCLGLSGRTSSRTASRRMGTGERAGSGSPFTPLSYSDDREASDSDKDLLEKKRKKNTTTSGSNGNGANGSNGGDYGTPSSTKASLSSSSSGTKVKKQKQTDSSEYPAKIQKSSLLAKASKASASSSVKLKGLGLHTPSAVPTPGAPASVGEISLGYLDDSLLLANGRSLQNGSGGGSSSNNNNNGTSNSSTPQKLSSSNPKKSSGVSSSKRPPGSSSSSKNGQVLSFHDTLRAIGSRDGEHSDGSSSNAADSSGDDVDDDDKVKERKGGGLVHSSSQPVHRVVLRLKKASAFSGHASDSLDTDFIDIDGDGDDDAMEILQTPKKKKS